MSLNWLFFHNMQFVQLSINSKVRDNNLSFEVLVGSDDKKGKNKIDILSLSEGIFDKNIITLNLDKGLNELNLVLKDNLKHTIRLKEYNK